jgi:MoCo/4Fe-4S cofactor protein with predicted Tat translocation signal
MSSLKPPVTGKAYWRSLEELADTPGFRAFMEQEFPNHAADLLDGPSRRHFLKIMGASLAFAGLTGCRRWPSQQVAPYAHRPAGVAPGVPEHFATAMEVGGSARGLIVTSFDGRPIKIEGNPDHPASLGAADSLAQASVLELYDPDRSRFLVERQGSGFMNRAWDDFAAFARSHFTALRGSAGEGFAVLCEATASPSVAEMRSRLLKTLPKVRWYEYEPVSFDNEWLGAQLVFGRPLRAHLCLDQADVIACLDADILHAHPTALTCARAFADGRRAADKGRMSRLYVAESAYTITGAAADHRLPWPSHLAGSLLMRLAAELFIHRQLPLPQGVDLQQLGLPADRGEKTPEFHFLTTLADDLMNHRGRSVLSAGPGQSPEVHAICHLLNLALGNVGKTVSYSVEPNAGRPSHIEAVKSLCADMAAGTVNTLLILGGNPAYDAPADCDFAGALSKVETTIHLSLYSNETSQLCAWHLPRAHYLESWEDARAFDGTLSVVQPLIEPLYGGRTIIEILALLLGEPALQGYDIVRRTFASLLPPENFEKAWRQTLHDGFLRGSRYEVVTPTLEPAALHGIAQGLTTGTAVDAVELVFRPDYSIYDGRFANNGWLQEAPDPLTKLIWDNAALIAPATAASLGVKTDDVVTLALGNRQMDIAVYVMPGQTPGSIAVPLGYGRTAAGNIGNGVGFNAYSMRTSGAMHVAVGVGIRPTGKTYPLASTQDHHAIDTVGFEARRQRVGDLVREATLEEYRKNPQFAHKPEHPLRPLQLWADPVSYDAHKWGMAIDLTACIGCNACTVACQAENNIPIVGKDQVARGREMNWIRVDRYFTGDEAAPQVVHQPLTCHHCENAPCEEVCPATATVHDTEGLNTMVYNRCVGTRYCSNNCPYKVRRFNYFDYHSKNPRESAQPWLGIPDTQQKHQIDPIKQMVFNPDVTVRMRGVMEKCTFCVQRIQAAKITAKNENRPLRDGEITPACAQTCPTQAIAFGDLNDPNSRVRKLHEHNRAYGILVELNVRPRTQYLAKLKNPADGGPSASENNNPRTERSG